MRIAYPQMDGSPSNTWRQTTNPVTATANGVDGYEAVDGSKLQSCGAGREST